MISLKSAGLIALTKLKARRIRTTLTVAVSGVLFGALVMGFVVVSGAFESINKISDGSLARRYIVQVNPAGGFDSPNSPLVLADQDLIKEAKDRYEAIVKQKEAEAKRLGAYYNNVADRPPYIEASDGSLRLNLRDSNKITASVLAKKYANQPYLDYAKLESVAREYGATKVFYAEDVGLNTSSADSLKVLPSGGEVFYDAFDKEERDISYQDPIVSDRFMLAPTELTGSMMFDGAAGWTPDSQTLPIVVSYSDAEKILGLNGLPASASASQQVERINTIKSSIAGKKVSACYRNGASTGLLQQAVLQQKAGEVNSSAEGWTGIKYALPDPMKCENPTIVSDTRTDQQIAQDKFEQSFRPSEEPQSYFVDFMIVGLSPSSSEPGEKRSVSDIIKSLAVAEGIPQIVPQELYRQIKNKKPYETILSYNPLYIIGPEDNRVRYVEFASAKDAQSFMDEQSCTFQQDGTCTPKGRLYVASLAFNDSFALDDLRTKVAQWFAWAMLFFAAVVVLIMFSMVARSIADSRHESAVFRAIGFRRLDIVAIYMVYATILSLCVVVLAISLGLAGAYVADMLYAPALTTEAYRVFGAFNSTETVSLFKVDYEFIFRIAFAGMLTGYVSAILPLAYHIRRNPIKDIKDAY